MIAGPVVSFFGGTPGGGELLLIFIAVLILFGPRRLPEIARSMGRILEDLRRAADDFKDQIMHIDADVKKAVQPPDDLPPSNRDNGEKDMEPLNEQRDNAGNGTEKQP